MIVFWTASQQRGGGEKGPFFVHTKVACLLYGKPPLQGLLERRSVRVKKTTVFLAKSDFHVMPSAAEKSEEY